MQKLLLIALALFTAVPAFAADELKTEEQKTLYAIGQIVSRQLSVFTLSPAEFEIVKKGLTDGMAGTSQLPDVDSYKKKTQDLAIVRRDAAGEKLAAASKEVLEKAAKEKGAVKTASGLVFQPVKEGTGESPAATDKVKVNYRGTLIDGKEFDSSYQRNQPAEFKLSGVIKCWTEGLQMMKPGGSAKLFCPSDIAYGKTGSGIIPANATLIFDVDLLEVKK